MRIFDADAHISRIRGGIHTTAEDMLRAMDRAGVSGGLVWLHPAQAIDEACDYDAGNRYVFDSCRAHSDRLFPVGWVNPLYGDESAVMASIRRQREEYGFSTVKFNGAQNFYDILSGGVIRRAMDEAVRLGLRLAFHCGNDGNTNPGKVGEIAARYPDTEILLVHMGQTACEQAILCAARYGNVHLIGSGMDDFSWVRRAAEQLGSDRVLYGSDAPFRDMGDILREYDARVLPGMTDEDRENIMGMNLLRFFA